MIDHLDHIVLTTRDLEGCIRFYRDVLGMKLESFRTPAETRQALKYGNQKINLHEWGKEFTPRAHVAAPGTLDLCFIASVPLEEVIAKLKAGGVAVAGEHLTGVEMAAALTAALGQEVGYNAVSPEVYRGFGFPGAEEMGNMFQVYRDFEKDVLNARSVETTRSLNPQLQSFDQWLAKNKSSVPV